MAGGTISKNSINVALTKDQLAFIIAISVLIIAAYLAYVYIPRPIYSIPINSPGGTFDLQFRADLREATKVPVYPSERKLFNEMSSAFIENITIAFMPVEEENGIYIAENFEIINKLSLVHSIIGIRPGFKAVNVSSYENLPGKIQNPIIALVHPEYANETSVRVDGHVVTISGRPTDDTSNPYKNLDLATTKFLMVVLGIEV